jgi:hypothetical protein
VNGQNAQDAVRQIGIPYYPYFIYYAPNSLGIVRARFNRNDRTEAEMTNWMLEEA